MGNGLVIGCVDNCQEIVGAEHSVLRNDLAAELRNLLVHCVEPVGVLMQSLAAFGSQRTEQDVGRHDFYLLNWETFATAKASRSSRAKSSFWLPSQPVPVLLLP